MATTTRSHTFNQKLKILRELIDRTVLRPPNVPQTSSTDIANTLKFFSQTLLSILKDTPYLDPESLGSRSKEHNRLHNLFPNLDYTSLYECVLKVLHICETLLTSNVATCEAVLHLITQLIPFLDVSILETIPYTVASTLSFFPKHLHKTVVDNLCNIILPLILNWSEELESYATESFGAILMLVFQHVDKPECHSQLVECLMSKKKDLCKDLLFVIAHGPTESRLPAVCLLYHYWPELMPTNSSFNTTSLLQMCKYKHEAWQPVTCERSECANKHSRTCRSASKMSIEPSLAVTKANKAPPFYVCLDCADCLQRAGPVHLLDILQPMRQLSPRCESLTCRNQGSKMSYATCFSTECARLNGGRPIRFCDECYLMRHGHGARQHVTQLPLPDIWDCPLDLQHYTVEAITSLLREAQSSLPGAGVNASYSRGNNGPSTEAGGKDAENERWFALPEDAYSDGFTSEDKKLLSFFGLWLAVEKCKPRENVNIELLGRILGGVFHWFEETKFLAEVSAKHKNKGTLADRYELGQSIEKIKNEYITKWLHEILKLHLEVVLSVLLPHPVEYARIGGYWDTLCSRTDQIREGLDRLFSLVPYDIVTFDVWDYVMPFWLEAIRTEVHPMDLPQLSTLLRKLYDLLNGPFPMMASKLFNFARERFENTTVAVQDQALSWLEILTIVEVNIPIVELLSMFRRGVESLRDPIPLADASSIGNSDSVARLSMLEDGVVVGILEEDVFTDAAHMSTGNCARDCAASPPVDRTLHSDLEFRALPCFIKMLEIILQQTSDAPKHSGIMHETSRQLMALLYGMLRVDWAGEHKCHNQTATVECSFCVEARVWHKLCSKVCCFFCPREIYRPVVQDLAQLESIASSQQKPHNNSNSKNGRHPTPPNSTAREQPSSQRGHGHESVSTPNVTNGIQENCDKTHEDNHDCDNNCTDDECKLFDEATLPIYLQFVNLLMRELASYKDPQILYHILDSFSFIFLHADALGSKYTDGHENFVRFAMRKYLICTLWRLLRADLSQIAGVLVNILLYCVSLKFGADCFWATLESDFTAEDWRVRFAAVEKTIVLARELNLLGIRNNQPVLTPLAHAFCNLIGSLDDIHPSVAQRTLLYLDTVKESSLKCMVHCLEFQFDFVINDRGLILQRMYQLSCALKNKTVLTWEFFLNRFDTTSLEAQLDLEDNGDIAYASDLTNSNRETEQFQRKLHRARFALARTDSVRSICSSAFVKPPYRRACSAPMHLLNKSQISQDRDRSYSVQPTIQEIPSVHSNPASAAGVQKDLTKEKSVLRQSSAPQFQLGSRRKSRPTLSSLGNSFFPDVHMRGEMPGKESSFAALMQRAVDLEGLERGTVHQLISLLFKFMSTVNLSSTTEDRHVTKAQNNVLRHLNMLLGYVQPSPQQPEAGFCVPPRTLRSSAVFHAFLSGIAKLMDRNFDMGNVMLNVALQVLKYCASPQRYSSDHQEPDFTIYVLEQHTRIQWLNTLLVILYKYQYNAPNVHEVVEFLIQIVINTIDQQVHRCKAASEDIIPATPHIPRPRGSKIEKDTSGVSSLGNILETMESGSEDEADDTNRTRGEASSESDSFPETVVLSIRSSSRGAAATSSNSAIFNKRHNGTAQRSDSGTCLAVDASSDSLSSKIFSPVIKRKMRHGIVSASNNTPSNSAAALRRTASNFNTSFGNDAVDVSGVTSLESQIKPPSLAESYEMKLLTRCEQGSDKNLSGLNFQLNSNSYNVAISKHGQADGVPPTARSLRSTGSVEEKMVQQLRAFEVSDSKVVMNTPGSSAMGKSISFSSENNIEQGGVVNMAASIETTLDDNDGAASTTMTALSEDNSMNTTDDSVGLQMAADTISTSRPQFRQRRPRKTGLSTVEVQRLINEREDLGRRRLRRSDGLGAASQPSSGSSLNGVGSGGVGGLCSSGSLSGATSGKLRPTFERVVEPFMTDRCPKCRVELEKFDEDTLGLAIVCLATFVHREPSLAAPYLLDMFKAVGKLTMHTMYSWRLDHPTLIVPGNSISIARQFLRCTLHQLAPNGIFSQLFQTPMDADEQFFKCMATVLIDFPELNCFRPMEILLDDLNARKNLPCGEQLLQLLTNMTAYLERLPMDAVLTAWTPLLSALNQFLPRLPSILPTNQPGSLDLMSLIKIITILLRCPAISSFKGLLCPFGELLTFVIRHSVVHLSAIMDLCAICNHIFTKERDKYYLTRTVICEFMQALKFKTSLSDDTMLLLAQFVLLDAGGSVEPNVIVDDITNLFNPSSYAGSTTYASEIMRQNFVDCLFFVADLHSVNKVKSNIKNGLLPSLHEDTLGGHLKSALAQFISLCLVKDREDNRDSRDYPRGGPVLMRHLPWLYHPPNTTQQGPREFVDSVEHVRLLSWLLIGAMMHTGLSAAAMQNMGSVPGSSTACQPIPLDASPFIAEHVMVIMTGYTEHSGASPLHMTALYFAFNLCALWTMYCENVSSLAPSGSSQQTTASTSIMDFWGKVTPGILQLLSHAKWLSDHVNGHLVRLMVDLKQYNSAILTQLMALWTPVFYAYHSKPPDSTIVPLQQTLNWEPMIPTRKEAAIHAAALVRWLKEFVVKQALMEQQVSNASHVLCVL